MGYTHYFTLASNIPHLDWQELAADCNRIAAAATDSGIHLKGPDGTGAPVFGTDHFAFNGDISRPFTLYAGTPHERASNCGESHESFEVYRCKRRDHDGKMSGADFCKTEHKPYDTAVTAIGCYLESCWPQYFSFSSDGSPEEWQAGLALARLALPEKGNQLAIPAYVIYDAQWQTWLMSGNRYSLYRHRDGSYRIIDQRVKLHSGVAIDASTAQRIAERVDDKFRGHYYVDTKRRSFIDRRLAETLSMIDALRDDPSRHVASVATRYAKAAGDLLATAGGV